MLNEILYIRNILNQSNKQKTIKTIDILYFNHKYVCVD